MKISSSKLGLAGAVVAALAPAAVQGNAWLSINVYGKAACAGQLLGWTQVDVTTAFSAFNVLGVLKLDAAFAPTTCKKLADSASVLKGSLSVDNAAYISTSLDFPDVKAKASIGMSMYINGTVVQNNMGALLSGVCVPLTISGQNIWINGGCTDATSAIAVPASAGSFAVRSANANADSCTYSTSYIIQGVTADNQAHAETGGVLDSTYFGVNYGVLPFTTTGSCSGGTNADTASANITAKVVAPTVAGVTLPASTLPSFTTGPNDRVCSKTTGNNAKDVYVKTFCKAGSGAAANGASLVSPSISVTASQSFAANSPQKYDFPQGGLTLSVLNTAQTKVDVAFSSAPATTALIPPSAFNTYYQITSDASARYGAAGFAANLTLTTTAAQLAQFNIADSTRLKWAKFNTASGAWDVKAATFVDATGGVTYTADGFSEWTVVYASATSAAGRAVAPTVMAAGLAVLVGVASMF